MYKTNYTSLLCKAWLVVLCSVIRRTQLRLDAVPKIIHIELQIRPVASLPDVLIIPTNWPILALMIRLANTNRDTSFSISFHIQF